MRKAHEPEGDEIAAVEGEVEKACEVEQEDVGEVLCLVEDDDGRGAALVDQVHEGLLEIGPELAAPMRVYRLALCAGGRLALGSGEVVAAPALARVG
jgi:hypothetical protein